MVFKKNWKNKKIAKKTIDYYFFHENCNFFKNFEITNGSII